MPAAAPAPALHCLTRTLLQADDIIRELRSVGIDGFSLITSARCACGSSAGIGPVGAFLARSGVDEMAAIDLPQAGRCVVSGNLLPILFGLANASKHAGIPDGLVDLGMSAADAAHCATMIGQGWTLIHVPVPTYRAMARCERIFAQAGAVSGSVVADPVMVTAAPQPALVTASASEAWVSAVRPARRAPAAPTQPTGPAVLAEAAW
jgi:hypothetical protein